MVATVRLERLREQVSAGGPMRVDRNAGVIYGVKILGRVSKNGCEYSDKAMSQAAKLYEGVRVNIDHPERDFLSRERGFLEQVGVIRNVIKTSESVRGDLHIAKSHPSADLIFECAERFPKQFGLSHNAEGETSTRGGRMVVESVESVRSVDIVCRPATNEGLFESISGEDTTAAYDEFEKFALEILHDPGMTVEEKITDLRKLLLKMEEAKTGNTDDTVIGESCGRGRGFLERQSRRMHSKLMSSLVESLRRESQQRDLPTGDQSYESLRESVFAHLAVPPAGDETSMTYAQLRSEVFGSRDD